jgi:hypothetical protein
MQVMFASVHVSHAGFYPDHSVGVEGSAPGMKNVVSVPLRHGTKSPEFRDIGTHFTCFTITIVQILTPEELRGQVALSCYRARLSSSMLTCADMC